MTACGEDTDQDLLGPGTVFRAISTPGFPRNPFQNLGDTFVRDPHLFDQMLGQRQCLRPHLHLRRSQSVGSLQGVPPLNASIAVGAVTGLDIEAPHHRLPHDVFLKLRLRVVMNDPPAAVGARLWQRNRNLFIDAIRNRTERARPVIAAALPSRPLRVGQDTQQVAATVCTLENRSVSSPFSVHEKRW